MSGGKGGRKGKKRQKERSWLGILVLLGVFALMVGAAFFSRPQDKLAEMERVQRDGYTAILWEDREYVPWSTGSGGRGKQLGYVDGDRADRVYAFSGMAPEEWILDTYDGKSNAVLYREKSVTDIPPELGRSDYPWNK